MMKPSIKDIRLKRQLLKWVAENLTSSNIDIVDADRKLEDIRVAAFSERRRYECDRVDRELAVRAVMTAVSWRARKRMHALFGNYPVPAFFEVGIEDIPQLLEKAVDSGLALNLHSLNADGYMSVSISLEDRLVDLSVTAFGTWIDAVDIVKNYLPNGEDWRDRAGGYHQFRDIMPRK